MEKNIKTFEENILRCQLHKKTLEETLSISKKFGYESFDNFQMVIYSLVRRILELFDETINSFQRENINAAILCTRALGETTALLIYLSAKSKDSNGNKVSAEKLQTLVEKILMGHKTVEDLPNPVHVNDAIRLTNKKVKMFEELYGELSEYAHPNGIGLSHTLRNEDSFTKFNMRNENFNFKSTVETMTGIFLRVCLAQSVTVLNTEEMLGQQLYIEKLQKNNLNANKTQEPI